MSSKPVHRTRFLVLRTVLSLAGLLALGCVVSGPAVSKGNMGNVAIYVYAPDDVDVRRAEIYLEGHYIGNATTTMPVLELRRGERELRVQMEGFKTVNKTLYVLGEPNHQVVNIFLDPQ